MNCPKCSKENSDLAKFCNNCGSPLSSSLGSIPSETDNALLLQKYIPPELAKKILSVGAHIESERRLVTVMFADVSGFTAMSEKLDPEEVSTVLNDCFKGLISIVYKYEGVIDKFIGDEIMAIFGAPLTHENDPERAVRCSMEMMEYMERFNLFSPVKLPEPLGLHISMNTGMVVAGNIGSDLRMNYSVIGDTVNLASRLKHIAERGEIVLSEDTFRIVSSLVNANEPQSVEVKGKSEPSKVYKIISLKGEIEPGTRVTKTSSIIGREHEIEILNMSLRNIPLKKEQRVFIRGEAGVGKTRLKIELVQNAKSSGITAYEGKCSTFEINTPYYLWTILLKDILQLKADTGESETRKRLHDMLQILSMEKHEPYLATLLSLRYEEILFEEDQERKKKIFESLKEFIRTLSKRKPSLFLLEDMHWIDKFSQDMLEYLFTEEQLAPAMFVLLFRDEYTHSKELIEKGGTLIDLNRLTKQDAHRLMCARLNAEEIPTILAELIYKRSEGNPFFIEELLKTLVDKNVVSVKKQKLEIIKQDLENILPATVQGVIMSRIDRLEEKLKDVLYGASVIGREFDKTLLKEILKKKESVDPSLHELLSLEMILEKEEAKELAYLFKHYLIQEVAYNTILQKKRKELHKLIAQAIEKIYADKLKEFYELLSFHYEKAEEWEKAAEYLGRAGRKVGEVFSKDASDDFRQRKETVINKIHESHSAKRKGWELFAWILVGISSPFLIALMMGPAFATYMILSNPSLEIGIFGSGMTGKILLLSLDTVVYTWTLLFFFYFLVLPMFRKKPKIFDLTDEQVRVLFNDGSHFDFNFADIKQFRFVDTQIREKRPLRFKFFDPLNYFEYPSKVTFFQLLKHDLKGYNTPYGFGFTAKEGGIVIVKHKGVRRMRLLCPWLHNPVDTQIVDISPASPKEFYEQLQVAFEKWKRQNKTGS